ncbi:MAG: hypothetical protein ACI9IL_000714 [Rickettsiales bacterium]|jgi:hypothetical protein
MGVPLGLKGVFFGYVAGAISGFVGGGLGGGIVGGIGSTFAYSEKKFQLEHRKGLFDRLSLDGEEDVKSLLTTLEHSNLDSNIYDLFNEYKEKQTQIGKKIITFNCFSKVVNLVANITENEIEIIDLNLQKLDKLHEINNIHKQNKNSDKLEFLNKIIKDKDIDTFPDLILEVENLSRTCRLKGRDLIIAQDLFGENLNTVDFSRVMKGVSNEPDSILSKKIILMRDSFVDDLVTKAKLRSNTSPDGDLSAFIDVYGSLNVYKEDVVKGVVENNYPTQMLLLSRLKSDLLKTQSQSTGENIEDAIEEIEKVINSGKIPGVVERFSGGLIRALEFDEEYGGMGGVCSYDWLKETTNLLLDTEKRDFYEKNLDKVSFKSTKSYISQFALICAEQNTEEFSIDRLAEKVVEKLSIPHIPRTNTNQPSASQFSQKESTRERW